jgi:hypothetical protein
LVSSNNLRISLRYSALHVFLCSCLGFPQAPPHNPNAFAEFRPRREIPGEKFVGREVCATCHAQKNRSQSHTAMAHALGTAADNKVLRSHPRMTFRTGPYSYEISSEGQQSFYHVTDGKETISEPILYVFGNAHIAQTYVLRRRGKLYEGRVSYYTGIDGLDWTIGDAQNPSPSLEEAFGRDISGDEARNCFSCHGTAAVVNSQLQLDRLVSGVNCEACHGPGGKHAATMLSGAGGEDHFIFNPTKLDPDTLSQEFCGACHRSANTVGMMPDLGGLNNVRFQPYRLSNSRGHDLNDTRFACTACHDPHADLKQDDVSYDSKCTTCHKPRDKTLTSAGNQSNQSTAKVVSSLAVRKSCPVANERCVSCHMPKVELAGAHFKFTDHRIRITRPGEPYPF